MFEELFFKKKINQKALLAYGFQKMGDVYFYKTAIMEGAFLLEVRLDAMGDVTTRLTEDGGEEYALYKTPAQGAYVGRVRDAISRVLEEIAYRCFTASPFRGEQTLDLIAYAENQYGDCPEFLWEKSPGNAILRRKDTGKWYAVFLTLSKSKLGFDSEKTVEIVNFHGENAAVEALLKCPHRYPAWHMNKKTWFTLILDGSINREELYALLDESYRLAKK